VSKPASPPLNQNFVTPLATPASLAARKAVAALAARKFVSSSADPSIAHLPHNVVHRQSDARSLSEEAALKAGKLKPTRLSEPDTAVSAPAPSISRESKL
jgi:hypothetical protein